MLILRQEIFEKGKIEGIKLRFKISMVTKTGLFSPRNTNRFIPGCCRYNVLIARNDFDSARPCLCIGKMCILNSSDQGGDTDRQNDKNGTKKR